MIYCADPTKGNMVLDHTDHAARTQKKEEDISALTDLDRKAGIGLSILCVNLFNNLLVFIVGVPLPIFHPVIYG